jgi:hypothetical protein
MTATSGSVAALPKPRGSSRLSFAYQVACSSPAVARSLQDFVDRSTPQFGYDKRQVLRIDLLSVAVTVCFEIRDAATGASSACIGYVRSDAAGRADMSLASSPCP